MSVSIARWSRRPKNPILQFMLCAVSDALQPVTNLVVFRFRDRKVICLQHQRLIEALEVSDAEQGDRGACRNKRDIWPKAIARPVHGGRRASASEEKMRRPARRDSGRHVRNRAHRIRCSNAADRSR